MLINFYHRINAEFKLDFILDCVLEFHPRGETYFSVLTGFLENGDDIRVYIKDNNIVTEIKPVGDTKLTPRYTDSIKVITSCIYQGILKYSGSIIDYIDSFYCEYEYKHLLKIISPISKELGDVLVSTIDNGGLASIESHSTEPKDSMGTVGIEVSVALTDTVFYYTQVADYENSLENLIYAKVGIFEICGG